MTSSLVHNDHLSALPPLPDTPRRPTLPTSSSSRFQTDRHHLESSASRNDPPLQSVVLSDSSGSVRDSPVLSTRQSGMNTARNVSPTKSSLLPPATMNPYHPPCYPSDTVQRLSRTNPLDPATIRLPDTPALPSRLLSPQPRVGSRTTSSSSFVLSNNADASLIGDCRPPSAAGFAEDSFDFGIEHIRPLTGRTARIKHRAPGGTASSCELEEGGERTPTKIPTPDGSRKHRHQLDQSTMLPSSPWRTDLLSSTNALSRVQAPWAESSAKLYNDVMDKSTDHFPTARRSPFKLSPRTASASKRRFPASSSNNALAAVGEEDVFGRVADQSALLPTSPDKMRHLLGSEHLLQNEDMSLWCGGDASASVILTTGQTPSIMACASKSSPPRASTQSRTRWSTYLDCDTTLDVRDLMAKMPKPKRASGTEESFIDLLRGAPDLEGINDSMMGADETFLPASLRPTRYLSRRSPEKTDSPIHRSRSTHAIAVVSTPSRNMLPPDLVRKSRRRSKSLSDTVDAYPDVPMTMRKTPIKTPGRTVNTPRIRHGTTPAQMLSKGAPLVQEAAGDTTRALIERIDSPSKPFIPRSATSDSTNPLAKMVLGSRASFAPAATGVSPRVRAGSSVLVSTRGPARAKSTSATAVSTQAPSAARAVPIARHLSKPVSMLAKPIAAPEAKPARASFRPTSSIQPFRSGLPAASSGPAREFGTDAAKAINRPIRPIVAARIERPSAAPAKQPARRLESPAKPRSLSTPASAGVPRPTTASITSRLEGLRKGPVPAESMLRRPVSRLPTTSTKGAANANMAGLRERIEKLQARTAGTQK